MPIATWESSESLREISVKVLFGLALSGRSKLNQIRKMRSQASHEEKDM